VKPSPEKATMLGFLLIVGVILLVILWRKFAEIVKEINRYDSGYIPRRRR
jgi:nitrate/TMAO reductase-like tetraheme cytochrome c subunit